MGNLFEKALSKNSVFIDRSIMSPHYTPNHLPFRENQINEITDILASALRAQKPDNIFIYGKTGTGKTSTTKFVFSQLEEFAVKNNSNVHCTYVNCRNHNSKYKVLIKVIKTLFPDQDFLGYSAAFVYEKLLDYSRKKDCQVILALDEIDKVKDLDELIYSLTRGNDELDTGGICVIGISNNLMFKDRLDPRTKSSLCEKELVFAPYDANELKKILFDRVEHAFRQDVVTAGAIALASGIAAQESGDARTAVMLMLRAGEIADKEGKEFVDDSMVSSAKQKVEEEIISNMISTLPSQQQWVLYAISRMTFNKRGIRKVTGEVEEGVFFSGDIYNEYLSLAKEFGVDPVSARWFRQYINELEMYGLILVTTSGKGIKGQTRLIKLGFDAGKIKKTLEAELLK